MNKLTRLLLLTWRAIWLLPILTTVCLLTAMAFVAYGPRSASQVWQDVGL